MLINRETKPWRALYTEFRLRPMVTAIVASMIPVGIAALILGAGASRAFTIIGGEGQTATLLAHSMGALLLLGAVLTFLGIVRLGSLVELMGLVFVSAGAFIYAAGVVIGLGLNGVIAGGGFLGITVGAAGRVLLLGREVSSSGAKKILNGG